MDTPTLERTIWGQLDRVQEYQPHGDSFGERPRVPLVHFGGGGTAALPGSLSVMGRQVDLGRAIPLYEQTLADRERVLGPDHPDTLTSRNNLAYA